MKVRQVSAAAMAVAGASAQSSSGADPVSYVTVTYDDCPTASIETMITVTNGVTVTYCPECSHTTAPVETPGHTTIYTTAYLSLCSTGLVPVTHTVTESCTEATPTWTPGPSHVPQGFTVTVKDCTVCEGAHSTKPVQVTITEPCDCEATSGTSLGPKPTDATPTGKPVQQISDGQGKSLPHLDTHLQTLTHYTVQNPTGKPVQQISDGQGKLHSVLSIERQSLTDHPVQNPAATPGSAGNVPTGPGATNPTVAPYPTTTTAKCPGPDCRAVVQPTGSGGLPAGPADTTSPSTPGAETGAVTPPAYAGSASSNAAFGIATTLAAVVLALAVAL